MGRFLHRSNGPPLMELNLNRNAFFGQRLRPDQLEEELHRYPIADEIYLRGHGLSALPDRLWGMTQLKCLGLGDNALTDVRQLPQLTRLEKLWLQNNQLTWLPREMTQLTRLHLLYLEGNPGLSEELQDSTFGEEDTQALLQCIANYHRYRDAAVALVLCWNHRAEAQPDAGLLRLPRDILRYLVNRFILGLDVQREPLVKLVEGGGFTVPL